MQKIFFEKDLIFDLVQQFISNKSINNLSSNPFEKIIKKRLNYYKKDNKK